MITTRSKQERTPRIFSACRSTSMVLYLTGKSWGKYFVQSGLFKVETLPAEENVRRPEYRMTLDYPEDLEFFRATIRGLDPRHERRLRLAEVVEFLDAHPEIAAISQKVSGEYWERFRREHGAFRMRLES